MSGFTKNMLKTGMRIKTMEGKRYLVMRNYEDYELIAFDFNHNSFMELDTHDEDLTYNLAPELSVLEVAVPTSKAHVLDSRSWGTIWTRGEPKAKPAVKLQKSILNKWGSKNEC